MFQIILSEYLLLESRSGYFKKQKILKAFLY